MVVWLGANVGVGDVCFSDLFIRPDCYQTQHQQALGRKNGNNSVHKKQQNKD